jgi:alpha-glucosidase
MLSFLRRNALLRKSLVSIYFLFVLHCLPVPAFAQWKSLGDLTAQAPHGTEIAFTSREAKVTVQVLAADLIRVRMHVGKTVEPDYSWAVIKNDWPAADVKFSGDKNTRVIKTSALEARIQLSPFQIAFFDPTGRLISADDRAMGWDGARVRAWKAMPPQEHYFGLGEKAGPLDKRGHSYVMWNTDPAGYDALTDPMYQTIPFFIGIKDGLAYGIFFDNTYRSTFDMGAESTTAYSFGADGGDLNYYFFAGPSPKQIIGRYTELVGRTDLPPMWSIGYLQSSAYYYPESTVRFVAGNFRQRHIPCDAIFLDTVYMDGNRVFTWNKKAYPDPPKMIADLRKDGFRMFAIVDPGLKKDDQYWAFQQGLAGNYFLKRKNGELYIGEIWPGASAFTDYTSEKARAWWGSLFEGMVKDGVAGFLTDMDEPTVDMLPMSVGWKPADFPSDVVYDDHGLHSSAAKNHNVFGLLMTQATRDGLLRVHPNERPFVITRATYAGGQRYAAQWTGDNLSTWEDLRASLRIVMGMGISGLPFTGSDTGGFIGFPSAELYSRWMQAGVFHPFFFTHTGNENNRLDPWSFGNQFEHINRSSLELRYRLLPYLYNAFYESTQTGLPIMRALVLDYPADTAVMDLTPDSQTNEFLFGDGLLVAPVVKQGDTQRNVYLPKGNWYDFWSGKRYAGPTTITVDAPLSSIPLFARGGAFIPMRQVVEYTDQAPIDPLTFEIYPEGDTTHNYYEDDGITLDYQRGKYLLQKVRVVRQETQVSVDISARQGSYAPPDRALVLKIHAIQKAPRSVVVDGNALNLASDPEALSRMTEGAAYDVDGRAVWIKLRDRAAGLQARIEE